MLISQCLSVFQDYGTEKMGQGKTGIFYILFENYFKLKNKAYNKHEQKFLL